MTKVRRLVPADAEALRDLRLTGLQSDPQAFGTTLPEARRMPLLKYVSQIESCAIFAAVTDSDSLIAMLRLEQEDRATTSHRGWITGVYTRPEYRGQGLATQLLDTAKAHAIRHDILQIELHVAAENSRAQAFYTRHGFVPTGRIPRAVRIDTQFHDDILMHCPLDA